MKRYKNKLISVLLLAFTFLLVHDYVIHSISQDMKHSVYVSQNQTLDSSQNIDKDICSDIHDNIHTMFEIKLEEYALVYLISSTNKPNIAEATSTSYISLVPNKPPVI